MSKETTYQRLKRENTELKKDLREVCVNPTSINSIEIIAKQKRIQRIHDAFSMPTPTTSLSESPGFLNFIITNDTKIIRKETV